MIAVTFLVVFLICSVQVDAKSFDWSMANTSVWLCAAAYCDTSSYLTRTYNGYTTGFEPIYAINEPKYDTQGYIGVMHSQSSIYVVYRGSTSIKDWLDDLDGLKTKYPLCSGCEVHAGFYKTEQEQYPVVKGYVASLVAKYPTYKVAVTGHSLGAALATLTAMNLQADGTVPPESLRMINFGSPRVGNTDFAEYSSKYLIDHNRVTHHKDIVVHAPMHERFTHIDTEWYQYQDDLGLKECSGYEDPDCSYQWHITSINDHLHYLTLFLDCIAV